MATIETEKLLAEAPVDGREEYLELFQLWKKLNEHYLAAKKGGLSDEPPMDASLDAAILAKLNPLERRLYDLPQQDHLMDEKGLRSKDLSPRWKHLTTILMARKGMRIEKEWARLG